MNSEYIKEEDQIGGCYGEFCYLKYKCAGSGLSNSNIQYYL